MLYAYTEKGRIIKPYGENVKMLHTEDIGYIRDGRIYFECRIRRIIKVSGHTIFATAVESVIITVISEYLIPLRLEMNAFQESLSDIFPSLFVFGV